MDNKDEDCKKVGGKEAKRKHQWKSCLLLYSLSFFLISTYTCPHQHNYCYIAKLWGGEIKKKKKKA